jgi:Putative Actinobacterial Holin-X, holin superfamily III
MSSRQPDAGPAGPAGQDPRDLSFGELTKQLSSDVSTLVRQELELARAEMTEKGKRAGLGAGLLGGATVVALAAFAVFTAFLVLILSEVMASWLAALIVALVYAAVAGVLALRGRREVQEAGKPLPEQTVESVKEDVQWAKTHARSSSR